MRNKLIFTIILGMFLISLVSATTTVTLNSPPDETTNSLNLVTFSCSSSDDSTYLTNLSLWTNSTGTWHRNSTNDLNLTISNNTATKHDDVTPILVKTIFLNASCIVSPSVSNTVIGLDCPSEDPDSLDVFLEFII